MVFDEGDMYKALGKSATKPPAKPMTPRPPVPAPAARVEERAEAAPAPRPVPPPEQKAIDLSKPEFIELAKSLTETCRFYKSVILPLVALMLVLADVAILALIAKMIGFL